MYKLIQTTTLSGQQLNSIKRLSDNAFIPFDPANTDYQEYLKWLDGYEQQFNSETQQLEWVKTSEGNEPLPADTPAE